MGLPSPGILSRCGRVLHAQELEPRAYTNLPVGSNYYYTSYQVRTKLARRSF